MGCLASKQRDQSKHSTNSVTKSTYSWSDRGETDLSQYTLENIMGETVVRLPGSIPGRPYSISNCLKSNIFLFDHLDAVNVSDCKDCTLYLGPTKGSIILYNCSNCLVICASMQLRCRDCYDLVFALFSSTNPSIESSHCLQFACFSLYYPQLQEQFNKAGLCIFNNNWHQVYDFNAFDGDDNHWILSSNLDLSTFYSEALKFLPEISCDPRKSIIPLTLGHRTPESDCNSCCLVVLFCDGSEEKRACDLIDLLTGQHSYQLIKSKRFIVSKILEEQVFQTENYSEILFKGPVIALELSSTSSISTSPSVHSVITSGTPNSSSVNKDLSTINNCCRRTQNLLRALDTLEEKVIYISDSPLTALEQVDLIFNSAN